MPKQGGTRMFCNRCDTIQPCKAIPLFEDVHQQIVIEEHSDLHVFKRDRECVECGQIFSTYELNTDFIEELVELRNRIRAIEESFSELEESMKKKDLRRQVRRNGSLFVTPESDFNELAE